jgi:ABC-type Na+ efflux pump permease subunit
MMGIDFSRVRAVVRKELRDYRRKRAIVVGMAVLPVVFLIQPIISIFVVPTPSTGLHTYVILPLLYMLLIPTVTPSTLAAYAVVGEREQGTLEPLLTTPIRREEYILGKAMAIMIPSLALSYGVFILFLLAVRLFAHTAMADAVFHAGAVIFAMFLFAPLLAGWGIAVGMIISVRANEVRVAQQLGMLASIPPLAVVILLAVGVVHPTFPVAILFALGIVALDGAALRVVARMFDRERLITGAKATGS